MIRLSRWSHLNVRSLWSDQRAAQIVEFAVSLPLLMVFVVGIFDFSNAYTLKHKLENAAREAARAAAAAPSNDISTATPASVSDAFQVINNYFIADGLSHCGPTTGTRSGLTWTFTATGPDCPAGGLTVIINRGYYFPQTGAAPPNNCAAQSPGSGIAVVGTCVSIQYAYQWKFSSVISVLVGSNTYASISVLTTNAVALNEN